jgi:predicted amidophosphoribosyltransferase
MIGMTGFDAQAIIAFGLPVAVLILLVIAQFRRTRPDADAMEANRRRYCPHCGHDLTHHRSDRCPECRAATETRDRARPAGDD